MRKIVHKYKAIRCELEGIKFPSKKERDHFIKLRLLKDKGVITHFHRQVPIHITHKGTPAKYVCDFLVFFSEGYVEYQDVKGMRTAMYKLKKKLVEEQYPFTITEY